MKSSEDLRRMLRGMDRKSYPAYKALKGSCRFTAFQLFIDHVQGDPFASPSSLHVEISHREAGFPGILQQPVHPQGSCGFSHKTAGSPA